VVGLRQDDATQLSHECKSWLFEETRLYSLDDGQDVVNGSVRRIYARAAGRHCGELAI
jgi:hypothetical protein